MLLLPHLLITSNRKEFVMTYLTKDFCSTVVGYTEQSFNTLKKVVEMQQGLEKGIDLSGDDFAQMAVVKLDNVLRRTVHNFCKGSTHGFTYAMNDDGYFDLSLDDNSDEIVISTCWNEVSTDKETASVSLAVLYSNHILWDDGLLGAHAHADFFNFYYHYMMCVAYDLSDNNKINGGDFFRITD